MQSFISVCLYLCIYLFISCLESYPFISMMVHIKHIRFALFCVRKLQNTELSHCFQRRPCKILPESHLHRYACGTFDLDDLEGTIRMSCFWWQEKQSQKHQCKIVLTGDTSGAVSYFQLQSVYPDSVL